MKHPRAVTLADVARAAGVAKSTASYAFSDPDRLAPQTTERVLAAAAQLGYQGPSALGRALASGRTHVVAVVTKALMLAPEEDPFALQIIDGLSRELHELGYGVLLLPPVVDEQAARLHAAAIYDGCVSVRRLSHLAETDEVLESRGVPWLKLDSGSDEYRAVSGQEDDATAVLLRHLVSLGHKRIVAVALSFENDGDEPQLFEGPQVRELLDTLPQRVSAHVPRARLRGFVGAGVIPQKVAVASATTYEAGKAAGLQLLAGPDDERPTAVVCQADVYAWGVIDAARELGLRVPEDVSVTGFDGLTGGVFDQLELTTVVQDGVLKGRLVARWMVECIERGDDPPPNVMPLTVRYGKTSGLAPA
ncbi:MAG: LacI family DNA-binding transcriptional regulator [Actinomycetes bacterium]|nr:MAG: LacI family transcriptional regulator [Actinomycetota bacterium]